MKGQRQAEKTCIRQAQFLGPGYIYNGDTFASVSGEGSGNQQLGTWSTLLKDQFFQDTFFFLNLFIYWWQQGGEVVPQCVCGVSQFSVVASHLGQ